jgi:Clathrin adaptor complex small chain
MVHDSISQRKGEDHKGCITTCAVQTDTHVQLPRVQRCAGLISAGTNSAVSYSILADEKLCCIDSKVVYRRYASLFFIAGCASTDNELITLEIVHRYVEQMDKYYGNVCELDIIFNFQKAYFILDELLLAGEMQESSKKNVLRCISQEDSLEDMEVSQEKSPCRLVSNPSRISLFPEFLQYALRLPRTNSACLPSRSRKTSQKLGERVAKRLRLHHLGSTFSLNFVALTPALIRPTFA